MNYSSNLFKSTSAPKLNEIQNNLDTKPIPVPNVTQVSQAQHYIKTTISKQKNMKKHANDSDVDDSDIEFYRPKVISRVINYEEDEKKYEILGARQKNGQLKFAVMHKDEGKIYWHSNESMKTEHLGMLVHYYESHIDVGDIVEV